MGHIEQIVTIKTFADLCCILLYVNSLKIVSGPFWKWIYSENKESAPARIKSFL